MTICRFLSSLFIHHMSFFIIFIHTPYVILKIIVIVEKSGTSGILFFFKHDTSFLLLDIHGIHETMMV